MSKPSRYLAFLAYLLSIAGALYVLLAQRRDAFAVYHAKQSLVIALAAILAPLIWVVSAWLLIWVPMVGPVIGAALFALLIATYIALAVSWIVGMTYALQGRFKPIPLVGQWARRLPIQPIAAPTHSVEPIERRTTSDA